MDKETFIEEFEKELLETHEKHSAEINTLLEEINEKMLKAQSISEKYGLPFDANMFFGTYVPKSFVEKANQYDELGGDIGELGDLTSDLIDVCPNEPYDGLIEHGWWQPSRFC
jgi:hypothetical protein